MPSPGILSVGAVLSSKLVKWEIGLLLVHLRHGVNLEGCNVMSLTSAGAACGSHGTLAGLPALLCTLLSS